MKMRECVWLYVLWLCLLGSSLAELKENYCVKNITISRMVPVTKQRTVIKQPSKWKPWLKAQKFIETYETEEEHISHELVTECCPGYGEIESRLCEPICERGCPAHASCVAPQRCQCTPGYVSAVSHSDGTHYCEPVCDPHCSHGSQCVAPNTCGCPEGYHPLRPVGDAVSAPCEPGCRLGNNCYNGACNDMGHCVCNPGFMWTIESGSCLLIENAELLDVTEAEEYAIISKTTASALVGTTICPDGFRLYAGECRPEFFENNLPLLKKCEPSDCGKHQICGDSGGCVCVSGYVPEEHEDKNAQLSCRRSLLDQILSIDQAATADGELNFQTIPILGVASGLLFVMVFVGVLTTLRKRCGHEDDEMQPQEPVLKCEFTQKSCDVDEWVP